MTALFDSGNSRLHFGWWNGETVRDTAHLTYPPSPEELAGVVRELLGKSVPESIAACSVSPKYGAALFEILAGFAPGKLRVVRTARDIGMDVRYDHPERFGIDRALAALAAYRLFRDSCVVIDAGTAVTIDAVSRDGAVWGGYIFPGEEAMAFALSARTGLPDVKTGELSSEIGTSTETCISRAIALGAAGAVRCLAERAAELVGADGRVAVTGGNGEKLHRSLGIPARYRPDLVLEGLGMVSGRIPAYRV